MQDQPAAAAGQRRLMFVRFVNYGRFAACYLILSKLPVQVHTITVWIDKYVFNWQSLHEMNF